MEQEYEKPTTVLEQTAAEQAKKEAIEAAITAKKVAYKVRMDNFITKKTLAMQHQKKADDLKKEATKIADSMGLTKKDLENLF